MKIKVQSIKLTNQYHGWRIDENAMTINDTWSMGLFIGPFWHRDQRQTNKS